MRTTKVGPGSRAAILLSVVLAACLLGLSADAKQGAVVGKISFLKGKAERADKADGPWKKLKRNQPVYLGDFVRTLEDSRLELRFSDGSVMRMAATSTLQVNDAKVDVKKQERNVSATLVAGKAWAKVSSMVSSDNKFEVKTENAVAGVRGTTFRINASEDKSTLIKVYAGAVAVSNAPFFEKKKEATTEPTTPIDFKNRQPVAQPFKEVSKKEWEQLCGEWMSVKVAADGTMEPAVKFAAKDDQTEDPDWVAWNTERDGEVK
ncbi:MAG: FecR family protein [Pseudomonadota bacterium]